MLGGRSLAAADFHRSMKWCRHLTHRLTVSAQIFSGVFSMAIVERRLQAGSIRIWLVMMQELLCEIFYHL